MSVLSDEELVEAYKNAFADLVNDKQTYEELKEAYRRFKKLKFEIEIRDDLELSDVEQEASEEYWGIETPGDAEALNIDDMDRTRKLVKLKVAFFHCTTEEFVKVVSEILS